MDKVSRVINNFLISAGGVKVVNADEFAVGDIWIKRLITFTGFFEKLKDVPGDVVECGVAWGKSLAILGLLVKHGETSRKIWG